MRASGYCLHCKGCRYLREWPEKHEYEAEALPYAAPAYMCVHPERRHPMRVIPEDSPYNPCASEGARTCPRKAQ